MNYLAHAYLSFNNPQTLVGNMISDFVKGNKRFDFENAIQKGITLHREIDTFTDNHAATKKAKVFLKPAVGLYAGAFIDIVYDHFLALDKTVFTYETLFRFSLSVYTLLEDYKAILPERFTLLLPYMKKENWLYNYHTLNGIEKSFKGLARRAKYLDDDTPAFEYFTKNYTALQKCYNCFFPDVKEFVLKKTGNIS